MNTKFEAHKIQREINRSGHEFTFSRPIVNEFEEPTNLYADEKVILKGIYHEKNDSVKIITDGMVTVVTKKTPMILCLFEQVSGVKKGDVLVYNSNTYDVVGIVNIQEWNIIADISLEVRM